MLFHSDTNQKHRNRNGHYQFKFKPFADGSPLSIIPHFFKGLDSTLDKTFSSTNKILDSGTDGLW